MQRLSSKAALANQRKVSKSKFTNKRKIQEITRTWRAIGKVLKSTCRLQNVVRENAMGWPVNNQFWWRRSRLEEVVKISSISWQAKHSWWVDGRWLWEQPGTTCQNVLQGLTVSQFYQLTLEVDGFIIAFLSMLFGASIATQTSEERSWKNKEPDNALPTDSETAIDPVYWWARQSDPQKPQERKSQSIYK